MKFKKSKPKKQISAHKEFSKELMSIGYLKNKKDEETRLEKLGMIKDHSLSQEKDKVYTDKKGKAHVVFRGTNPKDIRDIGADIALTFGVGRFTPRFRNAKRLSKKVKDKYGENNVAAYGHSLGGSLATESGINERVTYNKGVGIGGIGKQMKRGQTDYRNDGDAVSVLSKLSKYKKKNGEDGGAKHIRVTVGGNPLSAHALDTLQ